METEVPPAQSINLLHPRIRHQPLARNQSQSSGLK
jgi:hypothetical protein